MIGFILAPWILFTLFALPIFFAVVLLLCRIWIALAVFVVWAWVGIAWAVYTAIRAMVTVVINFIFRK